MSLTESARGDTRRFARGAGISLAGAFTGRGLYAITQVAFARLLGPSSYGLYGIGWSLLRLVSSFSPLGLNNGVVHFGSKYWRRDSQRLNQVIQHAVGLTLGVSVALSIGLWFAAPYIGHVIYGMSGLVVVLRLMAFAMPLASGLKVAAAATRITQKTRYGVLTENIGQALAALVGFLALYALGWRLAGALWATAISFGVALIGALWFIYRLFPGSLVIRRPNGAAARELLFYSIPTGVAGLLSRVADQANRLLLGYFRSAVEVGVFQALSQPTALFTTILGAFNSIFTPMIANLFYSDELNRLESLYRITTKWGVYVGLPYFIIILFAPREFMQVIFGARYAGAPAALIILSLGQLANIGTGGVGALLMMTGNQNPWLAIRALNTALNLALNLVLIPSMGLTGAAWASAVSMAFLYVAGTVFARQRLRLWPYDRRYWKGLVAAAVAGLLTWFTSQYGLGDPLVRLAVMGLVCGVSYVLVLLGLGLDQEDRELIRLVRRRLGRAPGTGPEGPR